MAEAAAPDLTTESLPQCPGPVTTMGAGKISHVLLDLRTMLDTIEPDDTVEPKAIDLYKQLMDGQARGASSVGD